VFDQDEQAIPSPERKASKTWIVTFTDLVSLMLTFFVMLFSMSTVKIDEWDRMIDALSQSLSPALETSATSPKAQYNISTVFRRRAINLEYLMAVLEEKIGEDPVLANSHLQFHRDRLVLSLPGDLLFATGSAVLSEKAKKALFQLGGVLRNINNQLGVNGHSDPEPIHGGRFASNWELSLARAGAVANALKRAGYTQDILVYGFGDSDFQNLPELPKKQRNALARRVDIVVLPSGEAL
jgi:chemotaxis protein MotB